MFNKDKIFFTSDTHFNHDRCIKYDNRPFATIEDMNETIIENWNNVVKKGDHIYHLGDVAFGRPFECRNILDRLNGKIYLVKGNHEKTSLDKLNIDRFEWVKDYYQLKINNIFMVLCHYPFANWNRSHYGSVNLHGHNHGTYTDIHNQLDVGTNCHNYTPISYRQVMETLECK